MFGVIEKSGTGIGKSGTGVTLGRIGGCLLAAGFLMTAGLSPLMAQDQSGLKVSQQGDKLMVSIHADHGVIAGMAALDSRHSDYLVVPLYSVLQISDQGELNSPLVQGSGSGTSSNGCGAGLMVQGSGSGASGESCRSAGAHLMVQGSGSGASGESCTPVAGLMVQGSGSGASGESDDSTGASLMVQGSGSGAPAPDDSEEVMVRGSGSGASSQSTDPGLLVQGSGSGASGESCVDSSGLWGVAEILVDASGTHVIVHQVSREGLREYMVAFDQH